MIWTRFSVSFNATPWLKSRYPSVVSCKERITPRADSLHIPILQSVIKRSRKLRRYKTRFARARIPFTTVSQTRSSPLDLPLDIQHLLHFTGNCLIHIGSIAFHVISSLSSTISRKKIWIGSIFSLKLADGLRHHAVRKIDDGSLMFFRELGISSSR